ncbi:MAG: FimB/Mfa2 family fimbrial subunit, partial [Muribaculaceae bacterium]|nr:FimB/Mfa2 family fimbrial subunit [Muribaculaceae bacterium]
MEVDLAPGDYDVLAYGGMECHDSSFSFVTSPESTKYEDVMVRLDSRNLSRPNGVSLHPLFYGRASVTVEDPSENLGYKEATVSMIKDTNNLRVILQQIDGEPLDNSQFDFVVTDDNTLFAYDNNLLPQPEVEYWPWARGNASPGELPDGSASSVVYAELSFPRLVTSNSPRLLITRKSDGMKVIDIPLNNYLLLLKSELFASMPSQEFLDRESRWSLLFFLDRSNVWIKTQIVINDWVVRINDIDGLGW